MNREEPGNMFSDNVSKNLVKMVYIFGDCGSYQVIHNFLTRGIVFFFNLGLSAKTLGRQLTIYTVNGGHLVILSQSGGVSEIL